MGEVILKHLVGAAIGGVIGWAVYQLYREGQRFKRVHREISREREILKKHLAARRGEPIMLTVPDLPPFHVNQYDSLEENRERMHEHIRLHWGDIPDRDTDDYHALETTLEAVYHDASVAQLREDLDMLEPEDFR